MDRSHIGRVVPNRVGNSRIGLRALIIGAVLLFASAGAAAGATAAFEAVSIRASPVPAPGSNFVYGTSGGPGTKDPGRWTAQNLSLSELIAVAYGVKGYQYSGPSWLDEAKFDVVAKIPQGATRDDLGQMIQNMLAERFGLKFHREEKKTQGFEMVIAKGGPKLGAAAADQARANGPSAQGSAPQGPPAIAPDGFPRLQPGHPGYARTGDRYRWQVIGETTAGFASRLAAYVHGPVWDATGLDGKHDFSLFWRQDGNGSAGGTADLGPSIFTAIQEQLGLRLVPKSGAVEVLVVDRIERTPTEN